MAAMGDQAARAATGGIRGASVAKKAFDARRDPADSDAVGRRDPGFEGRRRAHHPRHRSDFVAGRGAAGARIVPVAEAEGLRHRSECGRRDECAQHVAPHPAQRVAPLDIKVYGFVPMRYQEPGMAALAYNYGERVSVANLEFGTLVLYYVVSHFCGR